MNKKTNYLTFFLLCHFVTLLLCNSLYAFASKKDRGTAGAVFLKIGAGARATAMGEAFAGVADDVTSVYWNPSGLALVEKPAAEAMYSKWFQETNYHFMAFAYPSEIGVFGIGLSGLGIQNIEKREEDTEAPLSKFDSVDMAYTVSYARKIMEKLAVGASAKYIRLELDTEKASAFGADIGAHYQMPVGKLTAGLVVQNVGAKVKFVKEADPLPMNIKLGFGYKLFSDRLTLGLDVNFPNDNAVYESAGAEFSSKIVSELSGSIRAGFKTGMETGKLDGLSAGAGLGYKNFNFNFAWVPYGDLGNTFRYSLAVKF